MGPVNREHNVCLQSLFANEIKSRQFAYRKSQIVFTGKCKEAHSTVILNANAFKHWRWYDDQPFVFQFLSITSQEDEIWSCEDASL